MDAKHLAPILAVAGLSSLATYFALRRRCAAPEEVPPSIDPETEAGWLGYLWKDPNFENADAQYREWSDDAWRRENGWKGNDFIHNKRSRGPRVIQYFYDRKQQRLEGPVVFGPDSESHAGLCHGGSMTAVLDDVLGHVAFVSGGTRWGGATVSVNCSLKKVVRVGAVLKVWGRVIERRGRKVLIEGGLEAEDGTVHALLEGVAVECSREQLLGGK